MSCICAQIVNQYRQVTRRVSYGIHASHKAMLDASKSKRMMYSPENDEVEEIKIPTGDDIQTILQHIRPHSI